MLMGMHPPKKNFTGDYSQYFLEVCEMMCDEVCKIKSQRLLFSGSFHEQKEDKI